MFLTFLILTKTDAMQVQKPHLYPRFGVGSGGVSQAAKPRFSPHNKAYCPGRFRREITRSGARQVRSEYEPMRRARALRAA